MKWLPALYKLPVLPTALGISLLFSFYSVITHPLLNNDAYKYLRAAQVFQEQGLQEVLSLFGWYGYSIVFAWLDPLLPGELLASAQLVNAAAYLLVIGGFITLCRELYPDSPRRLEWFAALTVLCYPEINEMRYFLIRDIAYWGFSLLSLALLIRYARNPRLLTAIFWCLCLFTAIAFRLEGLLMLILAPLVMCFPGSRKESKSGILLVAVVITGAVMVWMLGLSANIQLLELIQFAYRYYLPLLFNIGASIRDTTAELTQVLFTTENFPGADNLWQGGIVIGFAYVFTVLVNLIYALSVPLTMLLAWAYWKSALALPEFALRPWLAYLGSALLALLLFMFIMHFLTQRYAVLASLLLLTLLPALLNRLWEQALASGRITRFRKWLIAFSMFFLIDSLISFGYSETYIEEAIEWTQQEIPSRADLYTNHFAIAYHSHKIADFDLTSRDASLALAQAQKGDYLVLEVKHNNAELQNLLDERSDLELLEVFRNGRDDQLRAYLVLPYDTGNNR